MKNTKKIRVAVLFGGRSPEHEVSVSSATNVMKHLDRSLFEVVPIKIDKQGTWLLEGGPATAELPAPSTQKYFNPLWLKDPEAVAKSELAQWHANNKNERVFDVIFPVMHGSFSEDGTIQGLLELADIPYVGCGVLASAVAMDKDVARRLVNHAGLPSVPYLAFKRDQWTQNPEAVMEAAMKSFKLPLFVKPANQGSSVGVTKVKKQEDLAAAIELALRYDSKILVEQGIPAIELEVSVIEALEAGEQHFVSLVGEATPVNAEFYSYDAKYKEGGVELSIPSKSVSAKVQETLRDLSRQIFDILGAEGLARIDFFVDEKTEKIYFNEMNSIPGFTPTSMHPQAVLASGVSYSQMLTQLVRLAIKRFEMRESLERNYQTA